MRELLKKQLLYGIVDTGYVGEDNYADVIHSLAAGGVKLIQFRAKDKPESFIRDACLTLAPICRELGVIFIVNDFPMIAAECGAGGVHIGQEDGTLESVKKIVGEEMIVGRSTHSYEQALAAWREGADYIGFGPLFPTATKPGRPAIGLGDITRVHQELPVDFPIYCIGGVQPDNLEEIMGAGAARVVIVSWLLKQPDISQASRELINRLQDRR